jgi:PAS domain S-box-containing protein
MGHVSANKTAKPAVDDNSIVDYANLFRLLPANHLVFSAKKPYIFIDISDAHSQMTGIPRDAVVGRPFFDVFPDVTDVYKDTGKSELEEVFTKVRRTKKPHALDRFRYDIVDEKGNFTERYWKPTHYPLLDTSGEVRYILQSVTDVTQDVFNAQRAGRIRLQLDEALSVGFVGSWDWDIQRNVVITDTNLARFFGVDPTLAQKGLPLETFTSSIHPSDRERVTKAIRRQAKVGGRLDEQYRTIDSTGTIRWIISRGHTNTNDAGEVTFFSGILIDITQQKKAEEIVSYQALITESIDDAIISLDLDGKITAWNPAASRLFGYTEDEAIGQQSEELLVMDSRFDRQNMRKTAYSGGSWRGNLSYIHKNGTAIEVIASVSALRDISGTPIGLVTVMQDLTRITEAQQQTEREKERTRIARQEARLLKRQNEDLVALNRTKDEFIALTSHQLRTPATGTKQYLGMLLEGYAEPLGPRQRSYMQSAYDCNERQLRVVDDILRVAQIDLDKTELHTEPTNIGLFVRQIVDEQAGKFEKRDHIIKYQQPVLCIEANIDKDRLRMALDNIIDNADKYTEPGGRIAIGVRKDRTHVYIDIDDEGVGIDHADYPKLFQKFSRIDNPLSVEVGGSGLGLYWSKRIIDMHGGTVHVESQLGKGTTFTVELPLFSTAHLLTSTNNKPPQTAKT